MRITALTENTAYSEGFGAEHGLSLFIETHRLNILYDMGQTALFEENAVRCGVDLRTVDCAVLSHGHYDHGGGLRRFLELNDHAPVYVSRFAFEPHYNGEKYIGLDVSLQQNDRLILTEGTIQLAEGIALCSCNDKEKPYDFGSFGLSTMENGRLMPDDFRHEQYLLIEEGGKRVLFSGCSHKGILNIMSWFEPDVLVGGFHFMKLPLDNTLKRYAEALDQYDTDYYTCHCTGEAQYAFMKEHMRRLHDLHAGQSIEL